MWPENPRFFWPLHLHACLLCSMASRDGGEGIGCRSRGFLPSVAPTAKKACLRAGPRQRPAAAERPPGGLRCSFPLCGRPAPVRGPCAPLSPCADPAAGDRAVFLWGSGARAGLGSSEGFGGRANAPVQNGPGERTCPKALALCVREGSSMEDGQTTLKPQSRFRIFLSTFTNPSPAYKRRGKRAVRSANGIVGALGSWCLSKLCQFMQNFEN